MKGKNQYNTLQNLGYLTATSWKVSKWLLICTVLLSLLEVAIHLVQLYLAPVILQKVETAVTLWDMLATIGIFTLALTVCNALYHWIAACSEVHENRLFSHFFLEQTIKNATTSYPNTLDTAFIKIQNQALTNMSGNSTETPPVAMLRESRKLITAILGFGIYLLVLTQLDTLLLVVTIVTTAISFFVNLWINRKWNALFPEAQTLSNEIMYPINTVNGNHGAKDIRIFHMQSWLLTVVDRSMKLLDGFYRRRETQLLLGKVLDVALTVARNAVAYVYLLRMVANGYLTAPEFLLHFTAITGFTGWITTILDSVIALHRQSQYMCHIRQHLQWPEPFRFSEGSKVPRREDGRYELRLENVSYRYSGQEKDTITNMDLTIRPGEKLAIVGLNGAGKTTLVKLLCGLLDPTEGRVLLNGMDIRQFDRRDYYDMFMAVFQDFSELKASIAANIAQSETDIDMEKVITCANEAGFAEVIAKLPKGVHTHLGKLMHDDGVELSGGQEQRLMLARALYKNAPVLLLDEPTAALDPIAENDIYLRYDEIAKGRTSIYISHRLASTRFCDRVLFLKNGKIAEEGTHEQLLALGGGYAELFEIQSRYYREGVQDDET